MVLQKRENVPVLRGAAAELYAPYMDTSDNADLLRDAWCELLDAKDNVLRRNETPTLGPGKQRMSRTDLFYFPALDGGTVEAFRVSLPSTGGKPITFRGHDGQRQPDEITQWAALPIFTSGGDVTITVPFEPL